MSHIYLCNLAAICLNMCKLLPQYFVVVCDTCVQRYHYFSPHKDICFSLTFLFICCLIAFVFQLSQHDRLLSKLNAPHWNTNRPIFFAIPFTIHNCLRLLLFVLMSIKFLFVFVGRENCLIIYANKISRAQHTLLVDCISFPQSFNNLISELLPNTFVLCIDGKCLLVFIISIVRTGSFNGFFSSLRIQSNGKFDFRKHCC